MNMYMNIILLKLHFNQRRRKHSKMGKQAFKDTLTNKQKAILYSFVLNSRGVEKAGGVKIFLNFIKWEGVIIK